MSADIGQSPSSASPDDRTLLVVKGGVDIWSLPLTLEGSANAAARPVIATAAGEDHAQLSPDGRWLAYTSDESQTREAYVMAYPGPGGKQQVSSSGASHVRWRGDGRELYYVTRSGDLMAAEITARGDMLGVGRTQRLLGGISSIDGLQGYLYDVARDGTRFIVAEKVERRTSAPLSLTFVQAWMGLLTSP